MLFSRTEHPQAGRLYNGLMQAKIVLDYDMYECRKTDYF